MFSAPWLPRALQLFLAACAALAVAWGLGLSNPFWAAMPVWVVSQAWREDLLIRGLLRVVGTLAGAGLGLAALAWLDQPALLLLAFAAGVGLATFAAFWIGTIYSYGALMAGITLGVVVLPAVASTTEPWSLATDRVWCTLIGVVAVTLATLPFTPRRPDRHEWRQDHGLGRAARNGLAAAGLSAAGLGLLLATGQFWAMAGALAVTVFASILGSMPDPRPVIRYLPIGAGVGVVAAILYRLLGDLLGLSDPGLFVLAVLFIAVGAGLRAHPRSAPVGLDANMCFLLTAEIGTIGHGLQQEALGGVALLCGALLASQLHRHFLVPPRPA